MKREILVAEERLRVAMCDSNLNELDALLAEQLIFTNHLGHIFSKSDDLESHRNKIFEINHIKLSEQRIIASGENQIVSVRAKIDGLFQGEPSNGDFRFTRVWSNQTGKWQVIVGHSCLISKS